MSNNNNAPDPTSQLFGILAGVITLLAAVISRLPRFTKKRDSADNDVRITALVDIIGEKQKEVDSLNDWVIEKDALINRQSTEIIRLNGVITDSRKDLNNGD